MLTLKEVNQKINQCKSKDWFKNIQAEFSYPHLDLNITKESFQDIYQYASRQKRGWDKIEISLPPALKQGKSIFSDLINELDQLLENGKNSDKIQLNHLWNSRIQNLIRSIQKNQMFTVDSPITTFLIEMYKKGAGFYEGAYKYLISKGNMSFNNPQSLSGALLAYEYELQGATLIPKRRGQEKSSNTRLRNSFERYFTETQKNVNEFYSTNETKTNEFAGNVDELLSTKRTLFENWFNNIKKKEEDYNKHNLDRIKELEVLYSDKLMLEKPADYWDSRARELKIEAKKWLNYLIGAIIISAIVLFIILIIISTKNLEDLFSTAGSAIRWSIIFVTLISFLAFAIRTFVKLSFSAFHLSRDAEERKQLTYVYLALKQDNAVEESERILILQSIFSRADSGLLREDSSPTMPGSNSIIDKFMKSNN